MKRLGFAYDWSTEVTTCLPDYYRWNQWFFLKFYEQGLAYRKKSKVNWCPKCATVLANEQVVDGCCWRHEDTLVEQRELEQWFLRITNYADELLRDLDKLEAGRKKCAPCSATGSAAAKARWSTSSSTAHAGPAGDKITVFTTRIDTIYGATSLQLAPEHPLVADFIAQQSELLAKVDRADGRAAQGQRSRRHRRDREARRFHRPLRASIRSTASSSRSGWRTTS